MIKIFQKFGLLLATILSAFALVIALVQGEWALACLAAAATVAWVSIHAHSSALTRRVSRADQRIKTIGTAEPEKPARDDTNSEQEELTLRTLEELQLIRAQIAAIRARS